MCIDKDDGILRYLYLVPAFLLLCQFVCKSVAPCPQLSDIILTSVSFHLSVDLPFRCRERGFLYNDIILLRKQWN